MRRIAVSLFALWAAAAATVIDNPAAFVRAVYSHLAATPDYRPPEDIYTPRLKALFARDRKQAKGEVGCLDGVFWVDAQDWQLSDVKVTALPEVKDRQTVIAAFRNLGTPKEIRFEFQRIGRSWRLDDARFGNGETLTTILNCKP